MSDLADAIGVVANRIAKHLGKSAHITEEDTKSAFVTPILRSLGWNCECLDEVRHEYRHQPQDNPVDYCLRLGGKPRLYVEAKSLGRNLDDYKWGVQTINYANAAGVSWCALTDGNSWRVYRSNAEGELKEKLFLGTRLYDPSGSVPPSNPVEVLSLLSKESMRTDEIEFRWQRTTDEKRVGNALRDLIERSDESLVHLIEAKTNLTGDAIQNVLRHARVVVGPGDQSPDSIGRLPSEQQVVNCLNDLIEKEDASLVRLIEQRTKLAADVIRSVLQHTRVLGRPAIIG